MTDDFHAILLEGVFYVTDDGDDLMVQPPSGEDQKVADVLEPLLDKQVQFAVHHVPPMPPDPRRWGGGACLFQPALCPAGHHQRPNWLYNVSGQGTLIRSGNGWALEKFDGSRTELQLHLYLTGHQGRVAAATMFSVEEMRDKLAQSGNLDSVDALGSKASDLRDLLARLQQTLGDGKT